MLRDQKFMGKNRGPANIPLNLLEDQPITVATVHFPGRRVTRQFFSECIILLLQLMPYTSTKISRITNAVFSFIFLFVGRIWSFIWLMVNRQFNAWCRQWTTSSAETRYNDIVVDNTANDSGQFKSCHLSHNKFNTLTTRSQRCHCKSPFDDPTTADRRCYPYVRRQRADIPATDSRGTWLTDSSRAMAN